MAASESTRVGKRGTLVIPVKLRRRFGIEEGSEVIAEETPEGILIRPAMTVPVEIYSDERKADLLLSNSVDTEDYARAVREVRRMGLDSEQIRRAEDGHPVVIMRHGKAVAAIVPAGDLETLDRLRASGPAGGLASIAGGWEGSEELVKLIDESPRQGQRRSPSLD